MDPDKTQGDDNTPSFERLKRLFDLYINKVIADYPVREVVIESYYRAYPDKFREGEKSKRAGELKPLNPEVKKQIRRVIVNRKTKQIVEDAFVGLKKKYHVRVLDQESGVKK